MSDTVDCGDRMLKPAKVRVQKDDWWVFPESTLEPLEHPFDCTGTPHGRCIRGLTMDQCLHTCDQIESVQDGYFVEAKDAPSKSLCVPLDTKERFPNVDIMALVSNKSCFSSTDHSDVRTAFFRRGGDGSGRLRFLPDSSNCVLSGDDLVLESLSFGSVEAPSKAGIASLGKAGVLRIRSAVQRAFVRFGDLVSISNEGKRDKLLVGLGADRGRVGWKVLRSDPDPHFDMLQVLPIATDQNHLVTVDPASASRGPELARDAMRQRLRYGVPFVLSVGGSRQFLMADSHGRLKLRAGKTGPRGEFIVDNDLVFRLAPRGKGYRCAGSVCEAVDLADCTPREDKMEYKGKPVFREPGCYGSCNWADPPKASDKATTEKECPELESPRSIFTRFFLASRSAYRSSVHVSTFVYF